MRFGGRRMRNQQTVLHGTPQLNHQRILSLKLGKTHLFIAGQNLHQKLHPEAWGIVYVEFFFHDLVISVKDLFPKGLMNFYQLLGHRFFLWNNNFFTYFNFCWNAH